MARPANHFRKYSSIHRRCTDIDAPTTEWQITEKVDGCNFSFIVGPDGTVDVASRNRVIDPAQFCGDCSELVASYTERIIDLARYVRDSVQDERCVVQVYGEMYGKPIDRIPYGDDLQYAAFDIAADGRYLSPDATLNLCNGACIPHVPILQTPSLEQNSVLCPDAVMEGMVFKRRSGKRVVFKVINDSFYGRPGCPRPPAPKKPKQPKEPVAPELSEVEQRRADRIMEGMDDLTIGNAVSKVGSQATKYEIAAQVLRDLIEEEGAGPPLTPKKLEKKAKSWVYHAVYNLL